MEPLIGVVILMPHGTEFLKRSPVLSVSRIGYTVMRLFLCLAVRWPQASGKDKTMKTPIEFDYDLWTGEDGERMVRVKRTGEVCEVDADTFRLLRAEEKRLRRSMQGVPVPGGEKEETAVMLCRMLWSIAALIMASIRSSRTPPTAFSQGAARTDAASVWCPARKETAASTPPTSQSFGTGSGKSN